MIDPTWNRGNYLGRAEVTRYQPRMTLKLKLACDDRSDLRMNIGISGDENAAEPEHEFAPEAFNGWPLFGKGANAGHVPMAGPGDNTPLEVGIDLTSLLNELGPDQDGKGRFFLELGRADGSDASGEIHECAVLTYDSQGSLLSESKVDLTEREFGKSTLNIESIVTDLQKE